MENREIRFRAWDGERMHKPDDCDEFDFYVSCEGETKFIQETGVYETFRHLSYRKDWSLMQYTGLKDADGVADIYEGDIIDMQGNIKGNIYESPQIYEEGIDCIVTGMGTDAWRNTESVAMGRGCFYAEQ